MQGSTGLLNHITFPGRKENWLYACLCIISFAVVFVTTGVPKGATFLNAKSIYYCELLFIFLYFLILRDPRTFFQNIRRYPLALILLLLWIGSITLSLYMSPVGLFSETRAIARYNQTLMHVVFFVFVWDFIKRYKPNLIILYYTIVISTLVIIFFFFYEWVTVPNIRQQKWHWFLDPPFNSFIRHSGFQAAAALSFFLVLFVSKNKYRLAETINFLILITIWSFLFWTGGRGILLSVFGSILFCLFWLKSRKITTNNFIFKVFIAIILGLLIAEIFSIFHWNGIFSALKRFTDAESIKQFTSSRNEIWPEAWAHFQRSILFGYGSQAYYFLPSKFKGMVQPHNVILQFLLEWGIIGTGLFLYLLIRGFISGLISSFTIEKSKADLNKLAAGLCIVTLGLNGLTDGTFFHPQPCFYIAIAYAIWLSGSPIREKLKIDDNTS